VITLTANSVADTRQFGRHLASLANPGDVILLEGGLGAGKTAFVSGLAEGLGVTELVTSPSFVLVKRYDDGFMPLLHVDVYRLGSTAEFEDLGVIEAAADGVLVIEWGDSVASIVPDSHLIVAFEIIDENTRRLALMPFGAWNERRLEELAT
jgi:tRNA threonylcarbamoyladenosine biosynthesis protein TsaE